MVYCKQQAIVLQEIKLHAGIQSKQSLLLAGLLQAVVLQVAVLQAVVLQVAMQQAIVPQQSYFKQE